MSGSGVDKLLVFPTAAVGEQTSDECRLLVEPALGAVAAVTVWRSSGSVDAAVADDLGGPAPPTGLVELRLRERRPVREVAQVVRRALPDGWVGVAVRERLHLAEQPADAGILRVGLLRRLPTLDRPAFSAHWDCVHAPLVLGAGPGFRRYVTNTVADGRRTPDGIVQQWFPDRAALRRHDRSISVSMPEIAADIGAFVGGFTDFVTEPVDRPARPSDREERP